MNDAMKGFLFTLQFTLILVVVLTGSAAFAVAALLAAGLFIAAYWEAK